MEDKALVTQQSLSREQIDLIKKTVAHGATDTELQLFLYQAKKRGLDPLTRQIHFIKRKRYNPEIEKYEDMGTIQTGIDGFRVIADRTGKLAGIKRGSVYSEKGDLVSAWAEVYRKDWQEPAREEVRFSEYCQKTKEGNPMGLWKTMPETMLKKVAEAAALRMAFPEDLSGIYSHDEMMQADTEPQPTPETPAEAPKPVKLSPVVQQPTPATPEQKKPAEPPKTAQEALMSNIEAVTDEQIAEIRSIAKERGLDRIQLEACMVETIGHTITKASSKQEADKVIKALPNWAK